MSSPVIVRKKVSPLENYLTYNYNYNYQSPWNTHPTNPWIFSGSLP